MILVYFLKEQKQHEMSSLVIAAIHDVLSENFEQAPESVLELCFINDVVDIFADIIFY